MSKIGWKLFLQMPTRRLMVVNELELAQTDQLTQFPLLVMWLDLDRRQRPIVFNVLDSYFYYYIRGDQIPNLAT